MILMLHNAYRGGGGENVSASLEAGLLDDAGLLSRYEVVENHRISRMGPIEKTAAALRSAYDLDGAGRRLDALLEGPARGARLVHVQNFFPLITPAIHEASRDRGIPSIQHLRNFRVSCVNAKFFRSGRVCEKCLGGNAWHGVVHGCHQRGRLAGAMVARMIEDSRRRSVWERVDAFITMADIGMEKAVEEGIQRERIYSKPNFIGDTSDQLDPPSESRDFLFVGRLVPHKGVETVVDAWLASMVDSPFRLVIVGDGSSRASIERRLEECGAGADSVVLLGELPHAEVLGLMASARCVVQPAEWYETFGRTVVEAFSRGRPVLASGIGALVDLVDETTGVRVEVGSDSSWAAAFDQVASDDRWVEDTGCHAREIYEARFTPERNLEALKRIYRAILDRAGVEVPEMLQPVEPAPAGVHYSAWL